MTRPDGTQRLCGEYTAEKTLSNLEHIFITRKSWENLGGLPGMYLSIRAAGSPDVTVHGPKVRGGSFFAMCLGLYFFRIHLHCGNTYSGS